MKETFLTMLELPNRLSPETFSTSSMGDEILILRLVTFFGIRTPTVVEQASRPPLLMATLRVRLTLRFG